MQRRHKAAASGGAERDRWSRLYDVESRMREPARPVWREGRPGSTGLPYPDFNIILSKCAGLYNAASGGIR